MCISFMYIFCAQVVYDLLYFEYAYHITLEVIGACFCQTITFVVKTAVYVENSLTKHTALLLVFSFLLLVR